jgi:hypothetical protein
MEEKKISSSWTKPMLVIMIVIWILFIPLLIFSAGGEGGSEAGVYFAGILYVVLVGITVYLSIYLSDVRLSQNEIRFKKLFRPQKAYTFDKIDDISTFRYKRSKYTTVRMENNDGSIEKYIILNNSALLSGERIDAEEILMSLKKK